MSPKPTVIIFAGGFHPASCMRPFTAELHRANFPAEAYSLSSFGDAEKSLEDDVYHMQSVITSHLDDGKDALLVVHSFAGVPAAAAVANLDRKSRAAAGKHGALIGVAFLAAIPPSSPGLTIHDLGQEPETWADINFEQGLVLCHNQHETFYNDLDSDTATAMTATLKGHSLKAMTGHPVLAYKEKEFDGRRAYIHCLKDHAVPISVQRNIVEKSGVNWVAKTLNSSHSPFISMPRELTKVVEEIINEFATAL